MDREKLESLKGLLDNSKHPWLFAAFQGENADTPSEKIEGSLGYFDWRLHGQVTRLVRSNSLRSGTITMIPSKRLLGDSNLLIYTTKNNSPAQDEIEKIVKSLEKLRVNEICFVESTWPEPVSKMIKNKLKKSEILCSSLEEIS